MRSMSRASTAGLEVRSLMKTEGFFPGFATLETYSRSSARVNPT